MDRVAGLATCAAELGASGLVLVVPSEDFSSTVKQDVQFRFDRETAGAGCEALDLAGVPIAVLESNEDNAFTSTTGDELALAEGDWFTLSWFPRSRPAQALDGTSLSAAAQRAELGASLALGMSSYALDKGVVARRDEVNAEATATATAAEAARLREQLAAALKENAALQVRIDHLRAVVPPPLHEVAATLVRFMASGSVPESESGTEATQDNDLAIAPAEASDVAAATVVAFVTRSKLSLLQSATDVHELAPCSAAIVLQAYARRKLGRLLFLEQRARLKRFGGYSGKPHLSSSAPPPHAHLLGGTSALDEGEGGLRGQNRIAGLGGTVATPSRLLVAGSGTLDAPLQRSLQESASLAVTGEMFSNTRTSGPEVSWSAASGWSTAGATMRQAGWDPRWTRCASYHSTLSTSFGEPVCPDSRVRHRKSHELRPAAPRCHTRRAYVATTYTALDDLHCPTPERTFPLLCCTVQGTGLQQVSSSFNTSDCRLSAPSQLSPPTVRPVNEGDSEPSLGLKVPGIICGRW